MSHAEALLLIRPLLPVRKSKILTFPLSHQFLHKMKAFAAILSALIPLVTASSVSKDNVDILRSAESILHAASEKPSHG